MNTVKSKRDRRTFDVQCHEPKMVGRCWKCWEWVNMKRPNLKGKERKAALWL